MSAVLNENLSLTEATGALLGMSVKSDMEMLRKVTLGLPVTAYKRLILKLPTMPLTLVASESTMRRRLSERAAKFSLEESERVIRIARMLALANFTFGDEARGQAWFTAKADYLPGEADTTPMEMCATEAGGRLVEERLRRSLYGFF